MLLILVFGIDWNKKYVWAGKYDGVFVVTGGILKGKLETIGDEQVAIPNQFYKILIDNNTGKTKMIAFLMPHQDTDKPLYDFVVSVDSIETITGIDFFPELEDSLENKLEASGNYYDWSFN